MKPVKIDDQLSDFLDLAAKLCQEREASALLVLLPGPTDWEELKNRLNGLKVVVTADLEEELAGAAEAGLDTIVLNMPEDSSLERTAQVGEQVGLYYRCSEHGRFRYSWDNDALEAVPDSAP